MQVVALSGISRESGGLFSAVRSLCKSLSECGVGLSVYGREDSSTRDDLATWSPVEAKAVKSYGPLGFSFQMRRFLMAADCDMIHLHGIWMDDQWAALQWQKKTGRPVVVSPHGMLDPWAVQNSAWKKKLVGKLFASQSLYEATCIHALCQSEAESIRACGLKNPIALIPNGVELPVIGKAGLFAQKSEKKQVLFLGRIHPKKGLDELIRAWATSSGSWINEWQLLIAGWDDGGHEEELRLLSKELGVDGSVSFIGPQFGDEKDHLFRRVDAFVLPSFSEGLPMTVLEAWAYGLPVVMTDFCNLPEGFEAEAAIHIEPDARSIADGLARLWEMDDADLARMGSRGRNLVEQQFTWDRIAIDMKSVYEWCLGGDKPACILEF